MSINNISEAESLLEGVLGKGSLQVFDVNLEELMYYIRSEALSGSVSDEEMQGKIFKLSEGILAASVKRYLDENFQDPDGCLQVNVGNGTVYDKDMDPIEAIRKIGKYQGDILSLLVSRGMYEFAKGRRLLEIVSKNNRSSKQNIRSSIEGLEAEMSRIEDKLPNLSSEEASRLVRLYAEISSRKQESPA